MCHQSLGKLDMAMVRLRAAILQAHSLQNLSSQVQIALGVCEHKRWQVVSQSWTEDHHSGVDEAEDHHGGKDRAEDHQSGAEDNLSRTEDLHSRQSCGQP